MGGNCEPIERAISSSVAPDLHSKSIAPDAAMGLLVFAPDSKLPAAVSILRQLAPEPDSKLIILVSVLGLLAPDSFSELPAPVFVCRTLAPGSGSKSSAPGSVLRQLALESDSKWGVPVSINFRSLERVFESLPLLLYCYYSVRKSPVIAAGAALEFFNLWASWPGYLGMNLHQVRDNLLL